MRMFACNREWLQFFSAVMILFGFIYFWLFLRSNEYSLLTLKKFFYEFILVLVKYTITTDYVLKRVRLCKIFFSLILIWYKFEVGYAII